MKGTRVRAARRRAYAGVRHDEGVRIADIGAAETEAAAEIVGVGDDKKLHVAQGALVAVEAGFEFLRVGRCGHLHEFGVLR